MVVKSDSCSSFSIEARRHYSVGLNASLYLGEEIATGGFHHSEDHDSDRFSVGLVHALGEVSELTSESVELLRHRSFDRHLKKFFRDVLIRCHRLSPVFDFPKSFRATTHLVAEISALDTKLIMSTALISPFERT